MDETQLASVRRKIIEIPPSWLTESEQKRRARRVARRQSRELTASPGEMALHRQMIRREAESGRTV